MEPEDLTEAELAESVITGKARKKRLKNESKGTGPAKAPKSELTADAELANTVSLGECPNCQADAWVEVRAARVTSARYATQPFGEPAGDKDEDVPVQSEVVEELPPSLAGAVDLTADHVKKARSAAGALARSLEALGLLGKYKTVIDDVLESIASVEG
jgi:hypothetical protein